MTKKEKKLLKAAKRLQKISAAYLEELTSIDDIIQELPVGLSRKFMLEKRYFTHVPQIAGLVVKMELLEAYISGDIIEEAEEPWKDIQP